MTHDQITNLFTGFRESIDRASLDARRTNVRRFPDPAQPTRFVTRRQLEREYAARIISMAAHRTYQRFTSQPEDSA